jgi:hypothetical protein
VFENAIASAGDAGGRGTTLRAITGKGVPNGYTAQEGSAGKPWVGPFASTELSIATLLTHGRAAGRAAQTINSSVVADPSQQVHWTALPHPAILFSLASGGAVALDSSVSFARSTWCKRPRFLHNTCC